jgi:hypothetical protein
VNAAYDTDYLAAEALIIARLGAAQDGEIDPPARALGAADLAGVEESAQVAPAYQVLYRGDVFAGEGDSEGGTQVVFQEWMTVIAVRNVRGGRTGAGARAEAGPLIARALRLLNGHQLSAGFSPLKRVLPGPAPAYSDAGFAYFPIVHRTQIVTVPSNA